MKTIDFEEFYSTLEASQYLQLTKQTIQNYVRSGKLPKRKIGNQYYFTLEEIKSLIQLPGTQQNDKI